MSTSPPNHQSSPPSLSSSTTLATDNKDQDHYRVKHYPTNTPLAYYAVISLFRFVLAIFFNRIVIENPDLVPTNGRPTIVLANHSNSLTDALVVMAAVPRHARRMLRMTAKATHFRKGNFSSWLIEKAGSVPLMRPQDYAPDAVVDNSAARRLLIDALCTAGDAICIFPEGISRYHPALAPLKTGAARIAADVLEAALARGEEQFELNICTCSITYLHRQNFRSDVLVSFHQPTVLSPTPGHALLASEPATRRQAVVELTAALSEHIRAGTLDAPSWDHIRAANMARTLYAPFGTRLGLGPHVRLTQKFIDALGDQDPNNEKLLKDLLAYQDQLVRLGIKDDRVANNHLTSRRTILTRLALRLVGATFLFSICVPGIGLWLPIFGTTWYFAEQQRKKGPAWDTYDEVTQTKMLWGLVSGLLTYLTTLILTFPVFPFTMVIVPVVMWFTLRWIEDLVATLRAARSLYRMLTLRKPLLRTLRSTRSTLLDQVTRLATRSCGLPEDSQELLNEGREIVIKNGIVERSRLGYFSVRRRRKKDYNEVLRLWDVVEM